MHLVTHISFTVHSLSLLPECTQKQSLLSILHLVRENNNHSSHTHFELMKGWDNFENPKMLKFWNCSQLMWNFQGMYLVFWRVYWEFIYITVIKHEPKYMVNTFILKEKKKFVNGEKKLSYDSNVFVIYLIPCIIAFSYYQVYFTAQ